MQTIITQGVKVTIPTEGILGSGIAEVNPYAGNMSVENERIIGTVNTPIPFKVQCSLPINDSFAVPLEGLFGAIGRTVSLTFIDGVAERDVLFDVSGEWRITESQINAHLPFGSQFRFSGLAISITE
ncbi:hypothetical protein L5M43_06200 [Shewanella sp. SW36]|uniref:hypothetical protein n=1 Tax=unclassified Shewanella TaxID=196818 RepID=UPI0021DAC19C|nr:MULTISPECIES: hypothetical protein [unclassified Shewanella]MCU7974870.1 hypothetical protein [Shewanella sp. SW36]MCU7990259.1 hypothetical protein [Shewanella sp. SW1]MCU8052717.1 hypothetical protein [Shewanella sp. SM43]